MHGERVELSGAEPTLTFGGFTRHALATERLALHGRFDEAAAHYAPLEEGVRRINLVFTMFSIARSAGIAAAAGRQWDTAEHHFQTALRHAEEMPHKIELPMVRYWFARMCADRDAPGDLDRARAMVGRAIGELTEIGLPPYLKLANELQDQLG